ncbi:hypothetical protein I541_1071 [Mycobacteroides abscessus]|nr:hypothetical protein I541_1071 [Mycobacteroides abscessus]
MDLPESERAVIRGSPVLRFDQPDRTGVNALSPYAVLLEITYGRECLVARTEV